MNKDNTTRGRVASIQSPFGDTGHRGLSQLGWRVVEPDELEEFAIDEGVESYYWTHTEERTDETLPINGEPSPLPIPLGPCEEIDI